MLSVSVRTIIGNPIIQISATTTVNDAKDQLAEEEGTDPLLFDLYYEDQFLEGNKLVASYGVSGDSELELVQSKGEVARRHLKTLKKSITPSGLRNEIKRGRVTHIKDFLTAGVNPEGILCVAAKLCTNDSVLESLLSSGFSLNVNEQDANGFTPFHAAVRRSRKKMSKMLFDHGADISITSDTRQSPLHTVRDPELARIIIDRTNNIELRDIEGCTPLHSAVNNRALECVKLLIAAGSNVNTVDITGEAPLSSAIKMRASSEMIEELLLNKADVNAVHNKNTALFTATLFNRPDMVEVLLRYGADPNVRGHRGDIALHVCQNAEITKLLLNSGSKVNLKNRDGRSRLSLLVVDDSSSDDSSSSFGEEASDRDNTFIDSEDSDRRTSISTSTYSLSDSSNGIRYCDIGFFDDDSNSGSSSNDGAWISINKMRSMRRTTGIVRRCDRRWQSQIIDGQDEDGMGRPIGVPEGLTRDYLLQEPEYWFDTPGHKEFFTNTTDVSGQRMIPTERKEGEALFNTNPNLGDEGFIMDETAASKVQFQHVNKDEIFVPVFNQHKEEVKTIQLDSYIFGRPPETDVLNQMYSYEHDRTKGFGGIRKMHRTHVPGPVASLAPHPNGANQGQGMWHNNKRFRKSHGGGFTHGFRIHRDIRRDVPSHIQSRFLRMALSLKLMKDKLIIVDELKFPTDSVDLMRDWANQWGFDRTRLGAYIIDGGPRHTPSQEMHPNNYWPNIFTYGIQIQEPRSFNGYDCLRYHYCILTEGALSQLEDFFNAEKAMMLPPHLKKKLRVPLSELGETESNFATIEEEIANEVAEMETDKIESRLLDDPWLNGMRWDANTKRIKEHRKMVSEHIPRLGQPIGKDIRDYWESRNTRLPTEEGDRQLHEYEMPWPAMKNNTPHWI